MPISCLSPHRVPQTGVNSDWPSSVHFTFQLYRFQPVTTERLKLLEPERNSKLKSNPHYPCVLSLINKDGTLNSGMITILLWFCSTLFISPVVFCFIRIFANHLKTKAYLLHSSKLQAPPFCCNEFDQCL